MNERTWLQGDGEHPLTDDRTVERQLWTRRSALALTAGFFALGATTARASYTPTLAPRASYIVVSKANRVLELRGPGDTTLKRFAIHLGFDPLGPKQRSGDGRTPEGQYFIDRRNPRSDFFLSLGVSYPNANDVARARALGVQPGGDIMIHGGPRRSADRKKDWTAGCIAVSDSEMEEIWSMVPTGTPILILA